MSRWKPDAAPGRRTIALRAGAGCASILVSSRCACLLGLAWMPGVSHADTCGLMQPAFCETFERGAAPT